MLRSQSTLQPLHHLCMVIKCSTLDNDNIRDRIPRLDLVQTVTKTTSLLLNTK
ncbi:unnamed protein product [Tenebrio molitor]|nr:unnamed protein product [Tenebrio molitor]